MEQKVRQKHNYTSEIELKSLLIRVKNKRIGKEFSEKYNNLLNRYVKLYVKINDIKYPQELIKKKTDVKKRLKQRIVQLSEITNVNDESYERFGTIILLMIKKILTKSQFSGYTYKDEFYSDAIHKILKYLHNFDHTIISSISNAPVNSFAYISQIIHNSVLYILNNKKKENIHIQSQISMEILDHNYNIKNYKENKESVYQNEEESVFSVTVTGDDSAELLSVLESVSKRTEQKIIINIPKTLTISMQTYDELKPFLNGKINIIREK